MTEVNAKRAPCLLIRHGRTLGNLAKRYVGRRTDEGLAPDAAALLAPIREKTPAQFQRAEVFASPMIRCVETAAILFPESSPTLVDGLREIDFGDFEGKTYRELSDSPEYRRWIDSNGTLPFPNGESREAFVTRSVEAFKRVVLSRNGSCAPFVVVAHGGTVMAVMSALTDEDYFSFQPAPGTGYEIVVEVDGNNVHIVSYRRFDGGVPA